MWGRDSVLAGRYRLLERVGVGSMGDVWRARDVELDRDVAVKLQLPVLLEDPRFVERFRSEARILARLKHPGIVTVHDFGASTDPPAPYLVMELLEGRPLCDILAESDVLTVPRTLSLVAQTLDALEFAHRSGIVHRDVKPANLILDAADRVTVTDFGVARSTGAKRLTASGTFMGTVLYSAPEQGRSGEVTAAADLYAVGVIAYECLCGLPPFDADDSLAVMVKHATEPVPELPAGLPGAVRELILRALAKDPADRFASAAEMAEAARSARAEIGPPQVTFPTRVPTGTALADTALAGTALGDTEAPEPEPKPESMSELAMAVSPPAGGEATGKPSGPPTEPLGKDRSRGRRRLVATVAASAVVVLSLGVTVGLRMTDTPAAPPTGKVRPQASSSSKAPVKPPGAAPAGTSKSAGPPDGATNNAVPPKGATPPPKESPSGQETTHREPEAPVPTATGDDGTYQVFGAVGCSSGTSVVGVWVHGDEKQGWASLKVLDGGPRTAYSFVFPGKQSYSLHVGCGEDADHHWRNGPHTTTVSGTSNSFDCYDEPGEAKYGTCSLRSKS